MLTNKTARLAGCTHWNESKIWYTPVIQWSWYWNAISNCHNTHLQNLLYTRRTVRNTCSEPQSWLFTIRNCWSYSRSWAIRHLWRGCQTNWRQWHWKVKVKVIQILDCRESVHYLCTHYKMCWMSHKKTVPAVVFHSFVSASFINIPFFFIFWYMYIVFNYYLLFFVVLITFYLVSDEPKMC